MAAPVGELLTAGRTGERARFMELKVVARVGIEPTTRGFSVRRRARFGASKRKTGDELSLGRPNRPVRPSPSRTGALKFRPNSWGPDPVQRLARIATELFPNCAPAHSVPLPLNWLTTVGSGTAGACSNSRSPPDYEFATDRRVLQAR